MRLNDVEFGNNDILLLVRLGQTRYCSEKDVVHVNGKSQKTFEDTRIKVCYFKF